MASRPISPTGPTKAHTPLIQPNAHPYAIKTTSSGLLSRSNSSPHSAHHIRHHYIPPPPSRAGARVRHRHSTSLSSVEVLKVSGGMSTVPAPLPTPPSILATLPDDSSVSLGRAGEPKITHRRRAETMPSSSAIDPITIGHHSLDQRHTFGRNQYSTPEPYAGLPPNPKEWNTDELIAYLEPSLRFNNDTHHVSLVGTLEYVRARGFTGREFLRLTDADLAGTPLSDAQRTQLFERSRLLRVDVLRGRIHVDSYHSHEVSDHSIDIYSRSSRSSTVPHSFRGASVSVDDLRMLLDNDTGKDDFSPPSPTMPLHRSSSVLDASTQRYRDLARMRIRRRGKVKGLVETWERARTSGSERSASEGSLSGSEAESESEAIPRLGSVSDTYRAPESPSDPPSPLRDESLHLHSSPMNSEVAPQELPSLTPPPPYTHAHIIPEIIEGEEELSIEELLASSSTIPLSGARAWEADFGLGETVKRIPVSTNADAGSVSSVAEADVSFPKNVGGQNRADSVQLNQPGPQRSSESRRKTTKAQKRIVTAVFTGSHSDDVPGSVDGEMDSTGHHRPASGMNGVVHNEVPAGLDPQNGSDRALEALEQSIAETRAQVETFRLRLEEVEADAVRREEELEHAQRADSSHSSETDLRRRQPEVSKQVTGDVTAGPPRDETLTEGDLHGTQETMSMRDIARAVIARAMRWMFPYGHVDPSRHQAQDRPPAHLDRRSGANSRHPSPEKRGRLHVARLSCSMILVSFAVCAAVLRRLGFAGWVRRP